MHAAAKLTNYLHLARAIPFSHADTIISHAPFSLSAFVAQVPFSSSAAGVDLKRIFRRFLTYHPVNDYDFSFREHRPPCRLRLPHSASSTVRTPASSRDQIPRGFHRTSIIGICLSVPSALSADADPGDEIDHLFQYLNKVFLDFDLSHSVPENNVDIFLQEWRLQAGHFILKHVDLFNIDFDNSAIVMPE
ncbi:hypothetical protein ZIOFF_040756 [Zingiber officinale]|uniref:Uncharacterized protein n=1 Tax=Zingiber officinale TaxID=94328 RepID=A0A8J5G5M0_ZINOF|nr:hypothetical protein ZIOFF_040756 [Zingiber officinale]